MTRKQRKMLRKNKQCEKPFKITPEIDKILWQIARKMTEEASKRDRSKENKTFNDGEEGCYNFVGGKSYCENCYYKNGCMKRRDRHEKGRPEYDERPNKVSPLSRMRFNDE